MASLPLPSAEDGRHGEIILRYACRFIFCDSLKAYLFWHYLTKAVDGALPSEAERCIFVHSHFIAVSVLHVPLPSLRTIIGIPSSLYLRFVGKPQTVAWLSRSTVSRWIGNVVMCSFLDHRNSNRRHSSSYFSIHFVALQAHDGQCIVHEVKIHRAVAHSILQETSNVAS